MQKNLLQIIQIAASELGVTQPQVVVSSPDAQVQKLLSFTRAVGEDLLREHDWQMLVKRYTFTTTSGQEAYPLPSDFETFIEGTFYDVNNRWAFKGSKTPSEWEWLKVTQLAGAPFERFRVFGNQMQLYPVPGATPYTFVYEYMSNSWITSAIGAAQNDFAQDSDICLFDHRLMVYGIKWKWLSALGQDTSDVLTDYLRTMQALKGRDTPAQRLTLGGQATYPFLSTSNYRDGNWVV